MGRIAALMLTALLALGACGVGGPPEGETAVDLGDFWRTRR